MDLVQTVRKEGSRGGVNFSWDDVKSSARRENYLGHSLMAPVGRWQKNKDLSWYAKAEDAELTPEERAEREQERKREELRKVKEAEEDAMARALGLPVPDRDNANNIPLGMDKTKQLEVNRALKEALGDDVGEEEEETNTGSRVSKHEERRHGSRRKHDERDERSDKHRRRSRSRSRDRERGHRRRHDRSRSRSRDRRRRSRSRDRRRSDARDERHRDYKERSRSREKRHRRNRSRSRSRSRSPHEKRRHRRD